MLISMGSASELEYHLLLARDLGVPDYQEHSQQTQEIKRMLSTLITRLRHSK